MKPLLLSALVLLATGPTATAQKNSAAVVKATATGDKPKEGVQTITVTLTVEKGWHIYANPVGLADLAEAQTSVDITSKAKLGEVKVTYPAGKLKEDKVVGNYKIYPETVTITATVHRVAFDVPLEVIVKFQACNDNQCLLPATVKLMVP